MQRRFSGTDFSYHDFRDADISTYRDCVEDLIQKGYKVVRIGADTNQELDFFLPALSRSMRQQRSRLR